MTTDTHQRSSTVNAISIALLASTFLAGPSRAQLRRDTTAVRTVTYPSSATPPAIWRVDSAPLIQLGANGSGGHEEFSRITGLLRLSSGTIVVANSATNELRYFSGSGAYLRTAGRTGDGPGEFRSLGGIFALHDTAVASNGLLPSLKFSPSGKYVGLISAPATVHSSLAGMLGDGSALYMPMYRFNTMTVPSGVTATVFVKIVKVAPDRQQTTLVDSLQMASMVGTKGEARPAVFGARGVIAGFHAGLCTAYGATYAITCINESGRPTVRITWNKVAASVTASDRSTALDTLGATVLHDENGQPKKRTSLPLFAATSPVIASMHRTLDDELWVQSYTMDDALRSVGVIGPANVTKWTVFAADGTMLAAVTLPRRFTPFEMGRDYVLGVLRDDDDAEVVTMYRVRR